MLLMRLFYVWVIGTVLVAEERDNSILLMGIYKV